MDETRRRGVWCFCYGYNMGIDNPAMVMCRRVSAVQPPYFEKNNEKPVNGKLSEKDGALKAVYVTNPKPPLKTQKSQEAYYEPYDNREVKHPVTYWETLIHMLKASLGTGILAMPAAFNNAGWLVATIGTMVIGLICTYSIHMLISTEYELCKRKKHPSMTYPATAQAAVEEGPEKLRWLAPYVPTFCNAFLLTYQMGSCCIYVVFIASNIKAVVDHYQPVDHQMEIRWYMMYILVPLILLSWVRNLKYLAPLSSLANAATLVSFAIIFYYMFTDLPSLSTRESFGTLKGLPLFFGTVLFAMEAIGVVMPLENEMKHPRKFGSTFGVLNIAMIPITLLYTFVGFFGYLKYGPGVEGSLTLSLPPGDILAQSSKLMLAFAIYITHGLAAFVAFDITWREWVQPRVVKNHLLYEYLVRTGLILIIVTFAAIIPYLELFISLIGALCLATMGLAFPALIQLFTYWHDVHGTQFIIWSFKNYLIVVVALIGFVIGVTTSVEEIIVKIFST
uniref:Amino acid transporter transmembrane domain-containing protein n=2 Tax=Lygus hesperus TaxID=30085 RepID=A0A0K8T6A9_LYGHE